jgi:hypothetical protein
VDTPNLIEADILETSYGPVNLAHCAPMIREEIEILGDADPFASHLASPNRIRALLAGLDEAALDWRPAPAEWSSRQIVAHLLHTEIAYGYRYRAIVADPGCGIAGYDQDAWVATAADVRQAVQDMLVQLDALKSLNVAFLRGLTMEERARWGQHSERGPESVAALIGAMAGHDIIHERQIAENLRGWRASAD